MSEGTATVVVDVHEPMDIKMLLLNHDDVGDWLEESLDAADIIVNGVGFERKTPSDFESSMTGHQDRLDEQVEKLGEAFDHAYILLEGSFADFEDTHSDMNPQSARGKAASVTARHGIPVIPTGGEPSSMAAQRLLTDYAVRLGRKHTEDPTSVSLPTATGSDVPTGVRMWAVIPGVGPTRAEALNDTLGSPTAFVRESSGTLIPSLETVDGIGSKTARRIVEEL